MKYTITIDTDTAIEEMDTTSLWSLVGHFYPGYSNSDEIYYNDKLQQIADGEEENSESAVRILTEDFEDDREAAKIALLVSNEDIYDRTMTAFLSSIVSVERVKE